MTALVCTVVAICFSPAGHCDKEAVAVIDGAHQQLDVFAYRLNRPSILAALVRAKRDRHVQVRLLADRAIGHSTSRLQAAGIAMQHNRGTRIMHIKAIVADRKTVIFGSFNWTTGASEHNDEVLTTIRCPDMAARFTAELERRWQP